MTSSSLWRCQTCGEPLGEQRNGTLFPLVPVTAIRRDGTSELRCPTCGADRFWKPPPRREVFAHA